MQTITTIGLDIAKSVFQVPQGVGFCVPVRGIYSTVPPGSRCLTSVASWSMHSWQSMPITAVRRTAT